ncbi:general substrate transporter [Wallemia mellicola]|nr:hypothetical protein E3Q24_00011 [Wallemia mellicola]TIC06548.1 general substrate transporter [Wallemia mellicola]TIC32435.1 general substrate transporter [Wallemia mellicola]
MAEYGEGRGENQLIKHFGEFGEIEKVRVLHGRGCGFVKFKNECNAQFAKEAMGSQSLDEGETLNVRWATEDPKADAIDEDRKRAAEEGTEKVTKRLAMDTELIHATRQMEALQNGLPPPPPVEYITNGQEEDDEQDDADEVTPVQGHQHSQQPQDKGLLSGTSIQAINKLAQLRASKPTAVAVASKPTNGLGGLAGNVIHLVRSYLGPAVPLDENIWFHKQVAYMLLFWTIVHVTAHYVNFINVERMQLRPVAAWQIHYTQAGGITGHVMLRKLEVYHTIFEVGELGRPIFTFNIHLRYKSGQYIWIQLPELSKFQWHPFTITSAPEDDFTSIHVRQVGDFSKSLGPLFGIAMGSGISKQDQLSSEYVSQVTCNCEMPRLMVDGPYGAPADNALNKEVAVLIGAGIGVTPFASILKSLWYRKLNQQLGVLKRVEFYWICRETESVMILQVTPLTPQRSFIWFKKLLTTIEEGQKEHTSFININIYLTKWKDEMIHNISLNDVGAKSDPLTNLQCRTRFGRPEWRSVYSDLKSSITRPNSTYLYGREAHLKTNIATFFCGPPALARSIQEAIKEVGNDAEHTKMFKKKEAEVDQPISENASGVPTFMGLTGNKLGAAITATATVGFLLFDQGVMSGIITADQFAEVFPAVSKDYQEANNFPGDPAGADEYASLIQATYTSIYELGCLAGALFALIAGDKLGRCKMMALGAFIMVIGTVIQVTAFAGYKAPEQFCVGRVVTGVGNGINTATIPTWQAETSKSHNRGLLVCIEASMIATGTVIAYWIDFGLSFVRNDARDVSWRFPIAFQIVFAFGLFAGAYYLPDSPRWLLVNGHEEEGLRVVASLNNVPVHDKIATKEADIIKESVKAMSAIKAKKTDLFTGGKTQHLRRVWLGSTSQFFQQIGGCNAVIYFSPVIFQDRLGLERNLALILGGVNVIVYALCAYSSYWLVEHVGRRKMFLYGSLGQGLSMILIMACMIPQYRVDNGYEYSGHDPQEVIKGSVLGLFLFLGFFGATWLELPWLYPAEINPLRIRTNANAVSTMTNWIWNFAVVQWTPPMLASIDFGTFAFFGGLNLLFIPVIYFFYPETAGRSLEEIDLIFAVGYTEGKTYWKVANEMPKLSQDEIMVELDRIGLSDTTLRIDAEKGGQRGSSEQQEFA